MGTLPYIPQIWLHIATDFLHNMIINSSLRWVHVIGMLIMTMDSMVWGIIINQSPSQYCYICLPRQFDTSRCSSRNWQHIFLREAMLKSDAPCSTLCTLSIVSSIDPVYIKSSNNPIVLGSMSCNVIVFLLVSNSPSVNMAL